MQPKHTYDTRFWSSVRISTPDECWPWRRHLLNGGHGTFWFDGGKVLTHRYAFHFCHGYYPRLVLHLCGTAWCVNPLHLYNGSQAENMADAREHGTLALGERNGQAKLTNAQVEAIKADPRRPLRLIAADYGVRTHTISRIKAGTSRATV